MSFAPQAHFNTHRTQASNVVLLGSIVLLLLSFSAPPCTLAQPSDGSHLNRLGAVTSDTGPYICHGYVPPKLEQLDDSDSDAHQSPNSNSPRLKNSTGWELKTLAIGSHQAHCPDGYAFYSALTAGANDAGGSKVLLSGTCCRLPKEDILLDEHSYATSHCPQDSIATGFRLVENISCTQQLNTSKNTAESEHCEQQILESKKALRCTKINHEKYLLGEETSGRNIRLAEHFRHAFEPLYPLSSVPVAIRYGFGRYSRYYWNYSLCAGYPWGSLLSGKEGKSCTKVFFRQLRYRDHPQHGDAAVQMYPRCAALSDPLDPKAYCIP